MKINEQQLLTYLGMLCGLLVAVLAIVVQVGWFIHSITLVQISSDFSPMQFNTALCLLFCAINLIYFNSSLRWLKSTGLLAVVFALITVSQYFYQTNYGIDTLFIQPFTQTNSPALGRMSLTSGINFILMGSLLFLAANYRQYGALRLGIIILASMLIAMAIVPLLAYLSGIQTAYPWRNLTGMAVHTAFSFIFLGIGIICYLWAYSKKKTPYFLIIPVVFCLLTASFSISGAIHTYEDLKYKELLLEENYYKSRPANITTSAFNAHFLHKQSTYIAYFVLFFGLLTSFLLSLTIYFHIRWRQNAKALKDSEQRLHLAITGTTDGLFDWNVESGEFYYSPRFEEVLGYQTNSLDPRFASFLQLIHPKDKDKFQQDLTDHFNNKTPINLEVRLKNKAGEYIWFNFRGTPTCDDTGNSIRMTGFIADISARNEIDKMKNEFISTVSHELRTPMTSIGGSLALILGNKAGACADKIRDLLIIAERNCERLLRLINDILDIEKIAAGKIDFKLRVCDLAAVIGETVSHNQMFADKFQIKLNFSPLAGILVKVDVDRLIQVLTNLISNAVKFSKNSGTVTINMEKTPQLVRVNIINQGPGIPDAFKERIFQKFSQVSSSATKLKGSGLGLNISKAIMEKLGGNLNFTSIENQETTFYLELPIIMRT